MKRGANSSPHADRLLRAPNHLEIDWSPRVLFWIGAFLENCFGDGVYRLLTMRTMLATTGGFIATVATWLVLRSKLDLLPRDRGRAYTPNPELALGKPTGAGILFVPIAVAVSILVVPWPAPISLLGIPSYSGPWTEPFLVITALCGLSGVFGYLDDASPDAWSEYSKGAIDFIIAGVAAIAIGGFVDQDWWLPLISKPVSISPWVHLPLTTVLLWISINATNCTDGVDGLSGSLLVLAFFYLGGLLYAVVGHAEVSRYLELPHDPVGASWGILSFVWLGTLVGYLWFNAHPSELMMGDAGSRAYGLLLGVLVMASRNPFLILVVAGVVLVNGGTGLVKVALLRFFKIGILRNVRFPLHDHCRKNLGWTNPQVLLRFVLLQAIMTPILFVFVLKLRFKFGA